MNMRYRITEDCQWGQVSVYWTDDLTEALELAGRNPLRSVYDESEKSWVPLGVPHAS